MPDWSFAEFEKAVVEALRLLEEYVEQSREGEGAVVNLKPAAGIFCTRELEQWIAHGSMDPDSFASFLERYLSDSTHMHHPGYMAHQVAVPDFPAALGDLVHGTIHNPMAIYEMGPSAAVLELAVASWMLKKVGWGDDGGGVLTHGGSLANLTALLAARARTAPEVWENGASADLAILAPPSCHYSVRRAAAIMGLGASSVVPLEVGSTEVILPGALLSTIRRTKREGKRIVALVSNACATGTGLHDPLEDVGRICQDEDVWLHVDGAHGASALLSEKERHLLSGVELADSLTWDAHKMLRTSGLCTGVLFRDSRSLDRAFTQDASYLFYEEKGPGIDVIHRTVECTKSGLGLKVFLNLAWRGEKGIARYVEEQYTFARHVHQVIESRDGFSCPYVPEANIVCFRYEGDDGLQLAIRDRLLAEGEYHISSTEIGGRRHLRLTLMSPQTTEDTIQGLLDAIERIVAALN